MFLMFSNAREKVLEGKCGLMLLLTSCSLTTVSHSEVKASWKGLFPHIEINSMNIAESIKANVRKV